MNKKRGNITLNIAIIVIIVVSLIIVVAITFFGGTNIFNKNPLDSVGSGVPKDSQVEQLQSQNDSDEILDIENDLNNTNLEEIDSGMDQVSEDLNTL